MIESNILSLQEKNGTILVTILEPKLYQDAVIPLQTAMIRLLDNEERHIIVDLSNVEVINSSGIGVLILLWDRLSEMGGHLILAGCCALLRELFERMRLDLIFHTADSVEEALDLMEERK